MLLCLLIIAIIDLATVSAEFTLINVYWGTYNNPQKAHPGSRNAQLNIEIRNDLGLDLVSVVGCLKLPQGFHSSITGDNVTCTTGFTEGGRGYIESGEVFRLTYYIDIGSYVEPGTYYAELNISYISQDTEEGWYELHIPLTVSQIPSIELEVVDSYWIYAGTQTVPYPGSTDLTLAIVVKNLGNENITDVRAILELPEVFEPSTLRSYLPIIPSKSSAQLVFSGISVKRNASPGVYGALLRVNFTYTVYSQVTVEDQQSLDVKLEVSKSPEPGLRIVRVQWGSTTPQPAYPGARNLALLVEIENLGNYPITAIDATLELPRGFTYIYGGSTIDIHRDVTIGIGGSTTLLFPGIYISQDIEPGAYIAKLRVNCSLIIDTSQIRSVQELEVPIIVSGIEPNLSIIYIQWRYGTQPAVPLPGSRNLVLEIGIANHGEHSIASVVPEISLPKGFRLLNVGGSCIGGCARASVCNLLLTLNISNSIEPGNYVINLVLRYIANPGNGEVLDKALFAIPIHIDNPDLYDTKLELIKVKWGPGLGPQVVYPGSRHVALQVAIINHGIYTAQGVVVELEAPEGFKIIISKDTCSASLLPGTSCTATFYVDIDLNTTPNIYEVIINTHYFLDVYGAYLERSKTLKTFIEVSKPAGTLSYIDIVGSYWLNNYPVYPGDENATYVVTIANKAPYPVSGLKAELKLPSEVVLSNDSSSTTYLPGPIPPKQVAIITFTLSISRNAKPGIYRGELILNYILESGGSGLEITETKYVDVRIHKLGGFEPITPLWLNRSAAPGDVGSVLVITIRNSEVPSMKGIYADLALPPGFLYTINWSRYARITPVAIVPSILTPQELEKIISRAIYMQSLQLSAGIGDVLVFSIPLAIMENVRPGSYTLLLKLDFVDQWDSKQSIEIPIKFWLLGSTKYMEIMGSKAVLELGERRSRIVFRLKNVGSGPAYEVYVAIARVSPGISITSAVKYIPKIDPGEEIELCFEAVANPSSPYTGPMPALVMIIFADPLGYRHIVNQSITIYVEGYSKFKVIDVTVEPKPAVIGRKLTISGTLINLGTAIAKYSEIYLRSPILMNASTSYMYLGDVDVGAQMPFSLEAYVRNDTKPGKYIVEIILRYRNIYNEEVIRSFNISIEVAEVSPVTTPTQILFAGDMYRIAVIIAVVLFMILVGIAMTRYLRKVPRSS
mgnify:CR=1 FL=1